MDSVGDGPGSSCAMAVAVRATKARRENLILIDLVCWLN
jgi:hypothetical protein